MTTLRLALSAAFPGTWTAFATAYSYADTIGPADVYGNPAGAPASVTQSAATAASVTLPDAADDGDYEQQVFDTVSFGGTLLQSAAGLVTVISYTNLYGLVTGDAPGTLQTITADGPWNLIKDIAVSSLSAQALTVNNFVDVNVNLGSDPVAHTIDIEDAKRGSVTAGDGSENLTLSYLSNEYSWSNTFTVTLGNGNNSVSMAPLGLYSVEQIQPLTPMQFNTAPQKSLLDLTVGDGTNRIQTEECSATIHLGNGADSLTLINGQNEVFLGGGADTVALYSDTSAGGSSATVLNTDLLHLGSGNATVFLYDTDAATMPEATIDVSAPQAGMSYGASEVFYGHYSPSNSFVGGDWSHLTLNLQGFSPGSTFTVSARPYENYSTLTVQDASSHLVRSVALIGGAPTASELHVHFT